MSRRRILKDLISQFADQNGPRSSQDVLEIGAGMGGNLDLVRDFRTVSALDPSAISNDFLRQTRSNVRVLNASWPPESDEFDTSSDLILMLDVLEHLEDETLSLEWVSRTLRENGCLLLTVPAYQWLWSTHDVRLHHKRRYSKKVLLSRIESAGLEVHFASYFTTLFFPLAVMQRVANKFKSSANGTSLRQPCWPKHLQLAHRLVAFALSVERSLVRHIGLPFGLSIVVVAKKPS